MLLQRWWPFAGIMAVLSGCATTPAPIATAPPESPPLVEVRAQPSAYIGAEVRWGGTIAAIENREQESVLLIVGRPLDEEGKPRVDVASPGRFMAKVDGFLDPAIYSPGRLVTVYGTVVGSESRMIGSYSYRYPVVAVEDYYLWPRPRPVIDYDVYHACYDPFWYGLPLYPLSRFRFGYFGWGPYWC